MIRHEWTNDAHRSVRTWKLCLFGFALGVTAMGVGELLLVLSS